ncbi:MAG: hypothetical protein AAGJ82_01965 [Bacteroidota bacterium]
MSKRETLRKRWYGENPPSWTYVLAVACVVLMAFTTHIDDDTMVPFRTQLLWSLPVVLLSLYLFLGSFQLLWGFWRHTFWAALVVTVMLFYTVNGLQLLANFHGSGGASTETFSPVLEWTKHTNDGDTYLNASILLDGTEGKLRFYDYELAQVEKKRKCLLVTYRRGWLGWTIVERAEFAPKHFCRSYR